MNEKRRITSSKHRAKKNNKKMKRQHLSVQPIDNRPVPFKVTILSKEI